METISGYYLPRIVRMVSMVSMRLNDKVWCCDLYRRAWQWRSHPNADSRKAFHRLDCQSTTLAIFFLDKQEFKR